MKAWKLNLGIILQLKNVQCTEDHLPIIQRYEKSEHSLRFFYYFINNEVKLSYNKLGYEDDFFVLLNILVSILLPQNCSIKCISKIIDTFVVIIG